jgi:hypothetical protein
MGVIVGVAVGYAFGARAGEEGWKELTEAWKVIATSEEVRDMVMGGLSVARHLLARGSRVLVASGAGTTLRPVA